jgi:hypothetical protein
MRLPVFILILASCLSSLSGWAQTLTVRSTKVQAPEMAPFDVLELGYGTEQHFSVVPPAGWRAETDSQNAVLRFYSRTGSATFAIQFLPGDPREILASAEAIRQATVPHLENARIVDELPAVSSAGSGKSIHLDLTFRGAEMLSRAAIIPLARGHASFVLICPKDELKMAEQVFSGVLTSFRIKNKSDKPLAAR